MKNQSKIIRSSSIKERHVDIATWIKNSKFSNDYVDDGDDCFVLDTEFYLFDILKKYKQRTGTQ